jgi:type II restriction enzyme
VSRIDEARRLLADFNFDPKRCNVRSGLTLLALAQVDRSRGAWAKATNPALTVDQLMRWVNTKHRASLPARVRARKGYATGTRESFRRQTLHQFVEAGFVIANDDDPGRATNSDRNNYRLNPEALAVIQAFGTDQFDHALAGYLERAPGLAATYRAAREMTRIPITLPDGVTLTIGGGGQNVLIKQMIDDFCARFVPGGEVLYIGDAGQKFAHLDSVGFASLGVAIDDRHHGKMPDLVVHDRRRDWLILMEAASTHGPVDAKRHGELKALFSGSSAGPVYVSCFPDRATMRAFLADLAWETEAWCASDPTHMIHLDGQRFLGPYDTAPGDLSADPPASPGAP